MFEEWNNEIADESSFFSNTCSNHQRPPHPPCQILWDSNAPMADFPVAHHIMEISEDSAVEKAVVGVKLYGHSRFDNQVSSVSWPFLSMYLEEFIKIST